MLRYSEDKRYIIQENKNKKDRKQTFGPYDKDMLPEIKNSDGTERKIKAIPAPNEQAQDLCKNLPIKFIDFVDNKCKNMTLKDVRSSSNLRAKFMCLNCKNTWEVRVDHITNNGQSCPYCNRQSISFPEKYVFYCLKQINNNLQENFKISGTRMEFDMYDPASRFAIEFSSGRYHSDKQDSDEQKLQYAVSQNIKLIRIWQLPSVKQVDKLNDDEYIIPAKNSINGVPDLNIVIDDICQQYNLDQSLIDRKQAQDQAFIRTNKNPPIGESLLDKFPDLCRDWDFNKNGVIRPELLRYGSEVRVHWKCFYCGQEWTQQPNARTDARTCRRAGCHYCNVKIGKGTLKEIPYIPDNKSNKT